MSAFFLQKIYIVSSDRLCILLYYIISLHSSFAVTLVVVRIPLATQVLTASPATRSSAVTSVRQPTHCTLHMHSSSTMRRTHTPRDATQAELAPPMGRRGACGRAPRTTAPRQGGRTFIYPQIDLAAAGVAGASGNREHT